MSVTPEYLESEKSSFLRDLQRGKLLNSQKLPFPQG